MTAAMCARSRGTAGQDLTPRALRERAHAVAAGTRSGLSAAEIAVRAGVSARTVQRYRTRLATGWVPRNGRGGAA